MMCVVEVKQQWIICSRKKLLAPPDPWEKKINSIEMISRKKVTELSIYVIVLNE